MSASQSSLAPSRDDFAALLAESYGENEAFEGTVLAVTHDRWFARTLDRFIVFGHDGNVYESDTPVWEVSRARRDSI